uniref:Uncharacterized protein n=1 Tax=Magallana gigas TaxID=29159 RepID=K1RP74_MAGGI
MFGPLHLGAELRGPQAVLAIPPSDCTLREAESFQPPKSLPHSCDFSQNLTGDGYHTFKLRDKPEWSIGFKKRGKKLPGFIRKPTKSPYQKKTDGMALGNQARVHVLKVKSRTLYLKIVVLKFGLQEEHQAWLVAVGWKWGRNVLVHEVYDHLFSTILTGADPERVRLSVPSLVYPKTANHGLLNTSPRSCLSGRL